MSPGLDNTSLIHCENFPDVWQIPALVDNIRVARKEVEVLQEELRWWRERFPNIARELDQAEFKPYRLTLTCEMPDPDRYREIIGSEDNG